MCFFPDSPRHILNECNPLLLITPCSAGYAMWAGSHHGQRAENTWKVLIPDASPFCMPTSDFFYQGLVPLGISYRSNEVFGDEILDWWPINEPTASGAMISLWK